jgi:hypothetical protein
MINEHIEKFKDLYAEYVTHITELHNHHRLFVETVSDRSGFSVRRHLRMMVNLEREMIRASKDACKTQVQIRKQQERLMKQQAREEKKKSKRKKK